MKNLDFLGFELVMKKKLAVKKEFFAAVSIQSLFRSYITKKWYKKVHFIRTEKAKVI